jgi:two-component system, NtrC family, sensor kinase
VLKTRRPDASKNASSTASIQDGEVARLARELNEAREQQTATSEVLRVISSFPGNLEPVFASTLENAVHLCDAKFGGIFRVDGDTMRLAAMHNIPAAYAEARRFTPFRPGPKHVLGRITASKTAVQIADATVDPGYIERRPEMVAANLGCSDVSVCSNAEGR